MSELAGESVSGESVSTARPASPARRQYTLTLLAGAAGAALILLAVRQQWARAVFTPPKPLSAQVVSVSGSDLVPLAGALGLAALAGLAAVIATRGVVRRAAGVLLALFGAGAGAAVLSSVTAATVLSVAASKVASPASAAISGTAGSTTSGSTSGGALVVSGSAGQAMMTGTPWHVAVLAGALIVFLTGVLTVLHGPGWPVMSTRYDAPTGHGARPPGAAPGGRALDAATMWESLNGGEDPTDDPADDPVPGRPGDDQGAGRSGVARDAGAR
jgi:uncharacterized membrane protein (TIGR02234 family)